MFWNNPMRRTDTLSRRAVVAGLASVPMSVHAAPLIDLEKGAGLFSMVRSPEQQNQQSMAQLYTQNVSIDPAERHVSRPGAATLRRALPLILKLENAHTDETLLLSLPPSLELGWMQRRRLNHFMRDWREDQVKKIDPLVVKDLLEICRAFATEGMATDVRINSGYRSPRTNEMLRLRNHKVARHSLHVEGKAIDFVLPGVSLPKLSAVARSVCGGGVGTYRSFVHIDSGSLRRWSG